MRRLCTLASIVLFLIGCNPSDTTSTVASNSAVEQEASEERDDGSLSAIVVKVRIVPFTTAQGLKSQMVLTTWKNTGTATIRLVDADITAYDAEGNILQTSVKNYTIYATSNSESGVLPGKTHTTPKGSGFILMPSSTSAKKAEINITNLADSAGF